MIYIIDANNLAGQMKILFEDDFDKKLIQIVKEYFFNKKMKISLVFDSNEPMGDKYLDNNIEVIYTPRDNYYQSADDKVLELVSREIDNGVGNNQITVVTDDLDLSELVEKSAKKRNYSLVIIKARDFAKKIQRKINTSDDAQEKKELDYQSGEKITKELFKLWKDK